MNRRESIKTLGIGAVATGLLVEAACKTGSKKLAEETGSASPADLSRKPDELARDKKLGEEKFFTAHEMATITLLADIIIPRDGKSGSASDAKVPEFIEFIVNDMPEHQTPLRGGLRWLDLQCLQRYNHTFKEAGTQQQLQMVTDIAYPKKIKPGMEPGINFFNRIRDLTASGFFTSKIGLNDLGYQGNSPNKWEGVPHDVLKDHGFNTVWG